MARRLFFVPAVHSGRAELRGDDARHLSKVLRVERGHTYELSDNHQRYLAEVDAAHKDLVSFRILEKLATPPEPCRITLALALVKFDRLEWILEKATELGVHTIQPFVSDRSEPGLEKAAEKRLERWRKIVLESAQQSRRTHLPIVEAPIDFAGVLTLEAQHRVFLDEAATDRILSPANSASVLLMIGPEGGWTDRERTRAAAAGFTSASLGPRILRAETAAIAALSLVSLLNLPLPTPPQTGIA